MRTATPLATCSLMTERGSSATPGGDLHAPVGGAGVHDQGVGGEAGHALAGDAVAGGVLPQRGEERLRLALPLDAQDVEDVGRAAGPRRGRS